MLIPGGTAEGPPPLRWRAMGAWYWIGVSAGLGAAIGVLLAGAAGGGRGARLAVILLAGAAGAGVGWGIQSWQANRSGSDLAVGLLFFALGVVLLIYGLRVRRKLRAIAPDEED